jgi:hypothetical protein
MLMENMPTLKNKNLFPCTGRFLFITLFLLFILMTYTMCETISEIKDLRSNPIRLGSNQDLIRVNLGISENNPNTRIVNYVDLNNDKM